MYRADKLLQPGNEEHREGEQKNANQYFLLMIYSVTIMQLSYNKFLWSEELPTGKYNVVYECEIQINLIWVVFRFA